MVKKFKSKPNDEVLDGIKSLCKDKANSVYILTELPKEFLDIWFSNIENLGLVCEVKLTILYSYKNIINNYKNIGRLNLQVK